VLAEGGRCRADVLEESAGLGHRPQGLQGRRGLVEQASPRLQAGEREQREHLGDPARLGLVEQTVGCRRGRVPFSAVEQVQGVQALQVAQRRLDPAGFEVGDALGDPLPPRH
jgi:hypothetical protein